MEHQKYDFRDFFILIGQAMNLANDSLGGGSDSDEKLMVAAKRYFRVLLELRSSPELRQLFEKYITENK